MTTQQKIEVLEKAIGYIDTCGIGMTTYGVCDSISDAYEVVTGYLISGRDFMKINGMTFDRPMSYGTENIYCWSLTPEGDESRRAFLRGHIERLKKELTQKT